MTDDEPGSTATRSPNFALLAVYASAGLVGFLFGTAVFGRDSTTASLIGGSAAARVGFVLEQQQPQLSKENWARLKADVSTLRASRKGTDGGVFDLVIALRGLETSGETQWEEAERMCRVLKWSRCDRGALEELKRRSRP